MIIFKTIRLAVLLTGIVLSVACQAVDNPDAPRYLENFRAEVAEYEESIHLHAATTREVVVEYRRFIDFLENELEATEAALDAEVTGAGKQKFVDAGIAWRAYREAEKEFIASVWQPENFGSSSAVSRLAFYAELLESRVELLLKYRLQF